MKQYWKKYQFFIVLLGIKFKEILKHFIFKEISNQCDKSCVHWLTSELLQWPLILIWHRNKPDPMCSALYYGPQASGPVWTDSSAKQKCIGLLCDGWDSTLSQTLRLCSRVSQTPQLRGNTLWSQRLPMWTVHLRSLCAKKAKAHYQDSRHCWPVN